MGKETVENKSTIEKGGNPPPEKTKPNPSPAPPQTITVETMAPVKTKNAAALVEIGKNGIMLRSLDDLLRFARMAVAGGAAPKSMTEGAAAIAIQAGLERGLGLLGGLQQCVVINGVLSWRGQGAYALIQNSPLCKPGTLKFWHEGEGENMKGVATAWRVGYDKPDSREFTVKQAKQARLWGKQGPWQEYRERMLAWRALGLLARDVFPDVLGGFPLAEEAEDFEPVGEEKPPITSRPELAAPTKPDALLQELEIVPKEEVIEAESKEVQHANGGGKAAPPPSEPSCKHGNLGSGFCGKCSEEADAALAMAER
jgi:hypothetical protein